MAQFFNLFLMVVVAVLAQKSEGIGGIREKLERLRGKQYHNIQENPSYNKNIDQLVALLKSDTIKDLCESEKVNPVWCQYKQLLESNAAHEPREKLLKKKRSSSMCWPGLPYPCQGLVPARLSRAVKTEDDFGRESEFRVDANKFESGYQYESDVDSEDNGENEEEGVKRAMRCRPGLVNCRDRKKTDKRTLEVGLEGAKKPHCPQGWMYCL